MKDMFARVTLALLLSLGVAQAAVLGNLYQGQLLVPEQLAQPTDDQLREALQDVLIKVSGRSEVSRNPQVSAALQTPAAFLQGFAYESTQIPVAAGDGREVLGLRLQLEFDRQALDILLKDAGMPVLGEGRPDLLIWLVSEGPGQPRDFLSPESEIVQALQTEAERRALPVLLPLLDLDDQQAVAPEDIWGGFREPVEQASKRYRADAVLTGRLQRLDSGVWNTRWELISNNGSQVYTPAGSLTEQLVSVVDSVGDRMLGGLTIAKADTPYVEDGIVVEVSRLTSIDDYLQLLAYMQGLQPVEQVLPAQMEADRVILRVMVSGGMPALLEAMRLNPRLQAESVLPADSVAGPLYFRWR